MAISSSSFARALEPGVKEWWGRAYDEWPEECKVLFESDTSMRAYEEDVSISGFGLAQNKGEGDGIAYDTEKQGFLTRYSHVTYALGFIITREMVEDDLYDVAAQRKAKSLAFSMRQTKEVNAANVYNRAFNASYLGTGGLEMCSTAHVNVADDNSKVTVTIPVSTDPRVTGRKLYRTKNGSPYEWTDWILDTVANNVDTTYVDTIADGSLTGVEGSGFLHKRFILAVFTSAWCSPPTGHPWPENGFFMGFW